MKIMKKWARRSYRIFRRWPVVVSGMQWLYHKLSPLLNVHMRSYKYHPDSSSFSKEKREIKELKDVYIAIICDEMTYRGFKEECHCEFLTPANWMDVFSQKKPDIFLCESAWTGIEGFGDCWRGRIYKSDKARFENRKDLLNILDFCHRSGVPTVFWNKEDPVFFEDKEHDFVSTALLFDYIYTTSVECVEKYKQLGHQKVDTLMFGFAPKLFNPMDRRPEANKAVFAGSWYQDQEKRCEEMKKLFDNVLGAGLELEIYDRHWNSNNPINQYPQKYRSYIHQGVSFSKLSSVLKSAQYAININTVQESKTMFARRVFEMMASDLMVISNASKGMKELFGESVWFIDDRFDVEQLELYKRQNFKQVFTKHTCKQRLQKVMCDTGIIKEISVPRIFVIYQSMESDAREHFNKIKYPNKIGSIERGGVLHTLEGKEAAPKMRDSDFVIWIENTKTVPDLELMIAQYAYIDQACGICEGVPRYRFTVNADNQQTLFSAVHYDEIVQDKLVLTKKYYI